MLNSLKNVWRNFSTDSFSYQRSRSLSTQSEIEEQEQIRLVESPDLIIDESSKDMIDYMTQENLPSSSHDISNNVNIEYNTNLYQIQRPIINQIPLFSKERPKNDGCCSKFKCTPMKWLLSLIPILDWLPKYEWKKDLSYDLVAGFTVAVMHIPQGMAYALLGNFSPIVGIYMAFYPIIIYSFLGTSRQVSMGTFAVICLMTGKVAVERLIFEIESNSNSTSPPIDIDNLMNNEIYQGRIIEIATAISLAVGLWQLCMGIFRLGSLSLLLSRELVSGFTTGAAVHVLTSQIKNLFGVSIRRRTGIFKILLSYFDLAQNIKSVNGVAVLMSSITLIFLIIYNELLKPYISKKVPFPLPIELFTIIVGTLISQYWKFNEVYNVTIVSTISTGLPEPKVPPMDVFTSILVDGLIISIVAYAISISMCKIFATKHNYTVDANQELIAQGSSNVVGSFFSCAPIAASLSRSVIQDAVGGKTQLASLFSCSILIFVLLWIGPFFETLPNCILSAIIVVALKGMFLQFHDLVTLWPISKISSSIWIISFLATVVLDIEYGLGAGILLSLLNLIWLSNHGHLAILGQFSNTNIYADIKNNKQAREISRIKIIKYTGSLNFTTIENYIHQVRKILAAQDESSQTDIEIRDSERSFRKKIVINTIDDFSEVKSDLSYGVIDSKTRDIFEESTIKCVILEMSSLSSIDGSGVSSLHNLYLSLVKDGIQILFSACPPNVLLVMNYSSLFKDIPLTYFFPSTHDAVLFFISSSQQISIQQ